MTLCAVAKCMPSEHRRDRDADDAKGPRQYRDSL
jgi:hypothetical protein